MAIPEIIKQSAKRIRDAVYGGEVQESLAKGIEDAGEIANDSKASSDVSKATVLAIQEKYREQILAQDLNPNKDPELVDLRGGKATAGERMTDFEQSTTAQFQQTGNNSALQLTSSNIQYKDGKGVQIKTMTKDGFILASKNYVDVWKSEDNGVTFTEVIKFPHQIDIIRELSDGKILLSGRDSSLGNIGCVWVSNSLGSAFVKKITLSLNSAVNDWGFSEHENIIAISEYGNQGFAHKVYLSKDYGTSFSEVFNLGSHAEIPSVAHVHSVVYDKYWERLWVIQGDGDAKDKNTRIFYSDNLGSSWKNFIPQSQMLSGYAFENRVVFFSDASPNGVYYYDRENKQGEPYLKISKLFEDEPVLGVSYLNVSNYRRKETDPLICTFMNGDIVTEVANKPKFIWGTYDGKNFFEMWKDTINHKTSRYITAVGPTNDGKMLASFSGDGRYESFTLLSADLKTNKNLGLIEIVEDKKYITTTEMGLSGKILEDVAFMVAVQTAARLKKTLLIPKDQTIMVHRNTIVDVEDFSIDCLGKLKIVALGHGDYAEALKLKNCHNVNISELTIDCNVSNTSVNAVQSLHKALELEDCTNIKIGVLSIKNLSGSGFTTLNSSNVEVEHLLVNGNNTGHKAFNFDSSKNIHVKKTTIVDCGIPDAPEPIMEISTKNAIVENITMDELNLKNISSKTMLIDRGIGNAENIKIKANIYKKTGCNDYMEGITVNGATNLDLDLTFKSEVKGIPNQEAVLGLEGVNGFNVKLNIKNVRHALKVGTKLKALNGKIGGNIDTTSGWGVSLGEMENVDFELDTDNMNDSSSDTSGYVFSGSTPLTNVAFKNSNFGKGASTKDCVNLYQKTLVNVLFVDNDFTEWAHAKQVISEKSGIKRINNLGMNWHTTTPESFSGNWTAGDIIWNRTPTASGYVGWICLTAGRPGVWKGFGKIEA